VDNWWPAPGETITAYASLYLEGKPARYTQVGMTWRYPTGRTDYCRTFTNIDGVAACTVNIGDTPPGYWVYIDVVFVREDRDDLIYAQTRFLPDP